MGGDPAVKMARGAALLSMSHFVAGILRIVLLEASAALLVMDRMVDAASVRAAESLQRKRLIAAWIVAGLAVFSFTNFGDLRGQFGLVHPWEQYHFIVGSKYLPEVGYFDLYKATFLADREGPHVLEGVTVTRDLHTFDLEDLDRALVDARAIRARFSAERWAAFKADWQNLSSWPQPWRDVMSDHGNSGSPAWALVALPFVSIFGSSHAGQQVLGTLDLILMIVLFTVLARSFGGAATAVGLTIWSLTPFVFDYLAGSVLRWDWLFAVGMAMAFWRRERPFVAGAFLGYAIVSKLFPIFFGLGLGVWLVAASLRRRRLHPAILRLAAGVAAAAVVFVAASALAFGGLSVWASYRDRIDVAQHEKYYPNQYSFQTVYLQAVTSTPSEVIQHPFRPPVVKQSLPRVDVARHQTGLLLARLALTLLIGFAMWRSTAVEAFAAGPFLVYTWLTVNAYYWNMLGLPALALASRQIERRDRLSAGLLALHFTWAAFYLYQHLNAGGSEGYFVAVLLLGTILVWVVQAIVSPVRRDEPPAATARPIR